MDQEIDLMLQKKSQIIETGKQEYHLPERETLTRETEQKERKLGPLLDRTHENPSLSLEAMGKSLMGEPKDMDLIRHKGRIFMQRFETRNRIRKAI